MIKKKLKKKMKFTEACNYIATEVFIGGSILTRKVERVKLKTARQFNPKWEDSVTKVSKIPVFLNLSRLNSLLMQRYSALNYSH